MKYGVLILPFLSLVGAAVAQTASPVADVSKPGSAPAVAQNGAVFSTGGNSVAPVPSGVGTDSRPNTSGIPGAGGLFPAASANSTSATTPLGGNAAMAATGGNPLSPSFTNYIGLTNLTAGGRLTNGYPALTNGVGGLYPGLTNGASYIITNGVVIGTNGIIYNQNAGAGLGSVSTNIYSSGGNGSFYGPIAPGAPGTAKSFGQPASAVTNSASAIVPVTLGTPPIR